MNTCELINKVKDLDLKETYEYINNNVVELIHEPIIFNDNYIFIVSRMADGGRIQVGYELSARQKELEENIRNSKGDTSYAKLQMKQFKMELSNNHTLTSEELHERYVGDIMSIDIDYGLTKRPAPKEIVE